MTGAAKEWWNKPAWGDVQSDRLRAADDQLDEVLDEIMGALATQRRPAHKIRIWKTLMDLGPDRGEDTAWDRRRERFLAHALATTSEFQTLRTLTLMARSPGVERVTQLRGSLDYCLAAATSRRQRRQVVRESLKGVMVQATFLMDKEPSVAIEGLDVALDVAQQHDLALPWLTWWGKVRALQGGGMNDDMLMTHLVARGVDLNACDALEKPALVFLSGQRRNSVVVDAIDVLLRAGLDWTRTERTRMSSFVLDLVDQHPVVRKARLQGTLDADTSQNKPAKAPKM